MSLWIRNAEPGQGQKGKSRRTQQKHQKQSLVSLPSQIPPTPFFILPHDSRPTPEVPPPKFRNGKKKKENWKYGDIGDPSSEHKPGIDYNSTLAGNTELYPAH